MPDTRPSLTIKSDGWTDAYAATGIAVGTQLIVTVESGSVLAVTKATEPTEADGKISRKRGDQFLNKTGDSGLWLKSEPDRSVVNVSVY